MMERTKNFKLGCFHGKIMAKEEKSEAHLQRLLYMSQSLELVKSRVDSTKIRLFGYEVPLVSGKTRGDCVDLLGYDEAFNLYIVELKIGEPGEEIEKVIEQINRYSEYMTSPFKRSLESEFENIFFFPCKFKSVKKIILAPKDFYNNKVQPVGNDIIFAYIARRELHSKDPNGKPVKIHLKWKK